MEWQRPVPVVGDASAASQRAAAPTGWAFPAEQRDSLYAVINARRDIRRFRPDDIPGEVLQRVLAAAHAAPSVGHSQPWRFIVVRDPHLRDRAALLADRERIRQAALLEPDAGRRLLDLQLEGIREAPLGVVVCCDRRTPAAGVLGRATFTDADMWSCACAIQNLWLAARAEGLGLGWVTLFQPDELARLVSLPDGVATLGWLCLGWPDERPPEPGLQRAGWSTRQPLDQVVHADRWPADAPAAPASHLAQPTAQPLDQAAVCPAEVNQAAVHPTAPGQAAGNPAGQAAGEALAQLIAPGQKAVVGARDEADRLLTPPGSLGVLDRAVDRMVALGLGDGTSGTLILVAADHPVAALGVSAYPAQVTREVLAAAAAGQALGVTCATTAGLAVVLIDAGVDGPPVPSVTALRPTDARGNLADADAMSIGDTHRLVAAGRDLGRGLSGVVALGEVGVGNTTVAACLTAALLHQEPAAVVGLGSGSDSAILARKRDIVAAALERHGDPDPLATLAALGGPEIAVLTGVTLGATEAGAVVVMDGLATTLAALVAVSLEPGVAAHLIAGQRSRERAHQLVLTHLGCEPLLDLRIRAGEGAGACLATGMLLQALTVRRTTARVTY